MIKKVFLFLGVAIFSFVFLASCVPSIKRGSNGAGAKAKYRVFFVAPGINQYFISPLNYKGKGDLPNFTVDFTFRDSLSHVGPVTVNYTIIDDASLSSVDSMIIAPDQQRIKVSDNKMIYLDKQKKKYRIRYTSSISYEDLKVILNSNEVSFKVFLGGQEIFVPSIKKHIKTMTIAREQTVDVIELNRRLKEQ